MSDHSDTEDKTKSTGGSSVEGGPESCLLPVNMDTHTDGTDGPPPSYSNDSESKQSAAASSTGSAKGDATNESPPSYNSIFGIAKVREAAQNSQGTPDMIRKVAAVTICSSVCVVISTILMIAIPIAMIVMGAINLHKCPRERFIPIYLIVGGAFSILRGFENLGCHIKKKRSGEGDDDGGGAFKGADPCGHLVDCFLTAWFIAGCVWIYRIHNDYQSAYPQQPNYCDQTLYLFAFWITTSTFILMAFAFTCCCCILCVACCAGGAAVARGK